ncbi:MAG: AAA family ATPase [Verrucomicrobiota bacterium]
MTTNITQSLSERYRPTTLDDLVLAPVTAERLLAFRDYLAHPKPKAWLLHGETGLGKTTLARIAVRHFREKYRAHVIEEAGPRVRDEMVEDWGRTFCGDRWFTDTPTLIFIDEADAMSKKAMFSIRTVIEGGYANNLHWIMTSNQLPKKFGRALKSRLRAIPFSDQGLAPRMADHLVRISQKEGHALSDKEAMAIVRRNGNDIRSAVNELEAIICANRFRSVVGGEVDPHVASTAAH